MGGILDLARRDAANYISGFRGLDDETDGFEVRIIFQEVPDEVIKGLATKHHNTIDTEGNQVISKNTHITVNEADLVAAGITVRNAQQEVALRGKRVSYEDSSGVEKHYIIEQQMPNETLGHIVCILGDFTP